MEVIIAVSLLLVLGLADRWGKWLFAGKQEDGEHRLSPIAGTTGVIMCSAAVLTCIFGLYYPSRDDFIGWLGLMAFFALGGLYLILAACVWRVWVGPAGLQVRSEFGVRSSLVPWNRIRRVRLSTSYLIFEWDGGRPLKVSRLTDGVDGAALRAYEAGAQIVD